MTAPTQKLPKTAVLLLAHGSPDCAEDIPEFLLKVTGGRPIPPPVVEEVSHRYGLIGRSPLTELTLRQGELLSEEIGIPVYVGMRNWKPFISDVIQKMIADGIAHVVAICLAPQNSRTSVGLYRSALGPLDSLPFTIDFVEAWHDHPLLIEAFAQNLKRGLDRATDGSQRKIPVIFTAHSVPQRTIADGDPYETQAKATAALVAARAGIEDGTSWFAFQSQGMSGGPWLGPTVEDTILLLKNNGHTAVFVQPIGFLCDHVEILYDIDIAFRQYADSQGMRLARAESLNGSPLLIAALADLANSHIKLLQEKNTVEFSRPRSGF